MTNKSNKRNKKSTAEMVEIKFKEGVTFLVVKETLSRMGLAKYKEKKLYQSCHVFHKGGQYFLVHFKEMKVFDGGADTITDEDVARRNSIIKCLVKWNLIDLVFPKCVEDLDGGFLMKDEPLFILPYKQKKEWETIELYPMGQIVQRGNNNNLETSYAG